MFLEFIVPQTMSSGPVYPLIDSDAYADFFHHSVTRSSVHLPLAATPTASPTCSPTFYLVCYLTLHLFSSLILLTGNIYCSW